MTSSFPQSEIPNPKSAIGRPFEPDTVNTVEGRNSYSWPFYPFELGGAVFFVNGEW
ncbi:MAG: hypothetical protein QOJ64_3983 [Acidobacteriota bacterium]|nr:hypothetical protein [Acidobacteriota bacterium]